MKKNSARMHTISTRIKLLLILVFILKVPLLYHGQLVVEKRERETQRERKKERGGATLLWIRLARVRLRMEEKANWQHYYTRIADILQQSGMYYF